MDMERLYSESIGVWLEFRFPYVPAGTRAAYAGMIAAALDVLERNGMHSTPSAMTTKDILWLASRSDPSVKDAELTARLVFWWAGWHVYGRGGISRSYLIVGIVPMFPASIERCLSDWCIWMIESGVRTDTVRTKHSRVRHALWSLHAAGLETDPFRIGFAELDYIAREPGIPASSAKNRRSTLRQWVLWAREAERCTTAGGSPWTGGWTRRGPVCPSAAEPSTAA